MIYFLQRADGAIKIGYSKDIHRRMNELTTIHGHLDLLGWTTGELSDEQSLHIRFRKARILPQLEWFNPSPDVMAFIEIETRRDIPPRATIQADRRKRGVRSAVFDLLVQKFGDIDSWPSFEEIGAEVGVNPQTVFSWAYNRFDRFELKVLAKWCRYFNAQPSDVLVLAD